MCAELDFLGRASLAREHSSRARRRGRRDRALVARSVGAPSEGWKGARRVRRGLTRPGAMTTEGTAAGRPVSGSEWARSAFSGGWDKRGDTRWLYAVFFLLTMAQSLPLTAIQVVLNRDLGLQERPEALNRFFAVEFSMSMLKPIYAAVSDLLPIARRRRVPYMMIGGVMYAVMLQAYASVRTIGQLYAAGVCSVIFYAICETGADGLLVQLSGTDPRRAMSTQATGMLVRSAGSFVATALSIPLLAAVPARACISAAGLFALAAAAAAAKVAEEQVVVHANDSPGGVGAGHAEGRGARGAGAGFSSGAGFGSAGFSSGLGLRGLARFVRRGLGSPATARRLGAAAAFLFAYRVMPTAMVTFTAFTYARFSMPDSYRAGLLLVSMGGGVAATAAYGRIAAAGAPLSTTFVVGAFADAVLGLGRLIVVQADRRRDGGNGAARAPMGALVASDALTSFGQMVGYMPVLALAARCAPRGLEATGYSALLFVADLATGAGSLLAAELTRSMGLGAGEGRSWSRLDAYVWTCAGLKLAPLALLPLVRGGGVDDGDEGGGASYVELDESVRGGVDRGGETLLPDPPATTNAV